MSTTIKIKKKTLAMLTRIVGELTIKFGRKVSYDEAIRYLVDKYYEREGIEETDKATEELLKLLQKSFPIGGPEDFKEYDFNDMGE